MLISLLAQLCAILIDLFRFTRISSDDKDLENLVLRQQLDILTRKQGQVVRLSRQEKWTVAVLAASSSACLRNDIAPSWPESTFTSRPHGLT